MRENVSGSTEGKIYIYVNPMLIAQRSIQSRAVSLHEQDVTPRPMRILNNDNNKLLNQCLPKVRKYRSSNVVCRCDYSCVMLLLKHYLRVNSIWRSYGLNITTNFLFPLIFLYKTRKYGFDSFRHQSLKLYLLVSENMTT